MNLLIFQVIGKDSEAIQALYKPNSMRNAIEQYLNELERTEVYDEGREMSLWNNTAFVFDMSCTQCTASAMMIADRFGGSVWGYEIPEEYENAIAADCGGHDFAIVGKYLVDYWARFVNDPEARAIMDMTDPADVQYISEKYLPLGLWQPLKMWKKFQQVN